jgi:hypothetical protein
MGGIVIEKNIPAPSRFGIRIKYPFLAMKPGDSFALPLPQAKRLMNAASNYKRNHPGWNFITQTGKDEVRIWCLAVAS